MGPTLHSQNFSRFCTKKSEKEGRHATYPRRLGAWRPNVFRTNQANSILVVLLRQSNIVSRKEHKVHKVIVSFAIFVAKNHHISLPYLICRIQISVSSRPRVLRVNRPEANPLLPFPTLLPPFLSSFLPSHSSSAPLSLLTPPLTPPTHIPHPPSHHPSPNLQIP